MSSKRIVSCMALIWRAPDEVLLIQRAGSGEWTLPGGRIDDSESWRQCAIRESFEEVGVVLDPAQARDDFLLHYRGCGGARVFYFSRWNEFSGNVENREPHLHSEVAWFSIDALPTKIAPHLLEGVQGVLAGGGVRESGFTERYRKNTGYETEVINRKVRVKKMGWIKRLGAYLFPPLHGK